MGTQKISPQLAWAKRQKRLGRCIRCGKRRVRYQWYCNSCQAKFSSYMKRYRQAKKLAKEAMDKALGRSK